MDIIVTGRDDTTSFHKGMATGFELAGDYLADLLEYLKIKKLKGLRSEAARRRAMRSFATTIMCQPEKFGHLPDFDAFVYQHGEWELCGTPGQPLKPGFY